MTKPENPTRPSTVDTVQRLAVLLDEAMNYAARDMREQAQTAADIALQAIKEALEGSTTPEAQEA
jgi:hypothetical protein